MKRLICLFRGHRWKIYGANKDKALSLGHLHSRAGYLDLCIRCGKVWDDFRWGLDIDRPEFREFYAKRIDLLRRDATLLGLKVHGDLP